MYLAGLFDVWRSKNEGMKNTDEYDILYTFSIITLDALPKLADIHIRMPAILQTVEDVKMWLNPQVHIYLNRQGRPCECLSNLWRMFTSHRGHSRMCNRSCINSATKSPTHYYWSKFRHWLTICMWLWRVFGESNFAFLLFIHLYFS